uniref:TAFA chemokine like family member 5 n=1 Tax=Nothobranchius furzeri TaxID=105023 RepID=A0A8C6VWE9_NOTFU
MCSCKSVRGDTFHQRRPAQRRGESRSLLMFSCAGHLLAGTCEIVTLARDSSQPRRTIARQTARCACRKGQIAGTTRARPACVDGLLTVLAKTNTPHKRMIPIIHHPSFLGGNAAATPSVDNQSAATIRAVGRSNSASGFMLG